MELLLTITSFTNMLIAQITDLHLVAKGLYWLSQPSTMIQERVQKSITYLNQLDPRPDLIVLSGDATEDGSYEAYHHLKELLGELEIPLYMVPGNHDRREAMRSVFSDRSYLPKEGPIQYVIHEYPVRIIALDTLVEGMSYGELSIQQVEWLEETLQQDREKPTLIFMHHPPVKIGMKLFDLIHCRTPNSFEKLIRDSDQVIGILAGHYHHLCVTSFGGKLCFLAPSIAPVHYFAHPEHEYVTALELEDPGITLHRWQGGQFLTSHIVRLKDAQERIDWALIKRR